MTLVLLLALMLPLQTFASAWSCSAQEPGGAAVHHHCANDSGQVPTSGEQHHHCGACCAAAIALTPFRWTPPASERSEASLLFNGSPPKVALDRLDRPPRPV